MGRGPAGWERPRSRRRATLAAAAVLLVTAVAAATHGRWTGPPGGIAVGTPTPPPATAPGPARPGLDDGTGPARPPGPHPLDALPLVAGSWTAVAPPPDLAAGPAGGTGPAVWARAGRGDGELVAVLGGQPRVAVAYDPRRERWRGLPPPPGEAGWGSGHVAVWTGAEVVVWGRWEPTRTRPFGAAYDPVAGTWRELPPGPVDDLGPHPVAVSSGREVLVWGPTLERVFLPGPGGAGAAYDPRRDTWRLLPPAPVGRVTAAGGAWTGRGLTVWGSVLAADPAPGRRSFALRYDPAADRWRRLPAPPLDRPAQAAGVDTGDALVLWGRPHASDPGGPPVAIALDHDGGAWRPLRRLPGTGWAAGAGPARAAAVMAGRTVLAIGGAAPVPLALDPAPDGRWSRLASWGGPRREGASAFWTGGALLVWGGHLPGGAPARDLLVWRPDAAAVRPRRPGGRATAGRRTAAARTRRRSP